jgi:integrase
MGKLRTAPGMRERAPDVWEIVVQAGRDPITGKHRQVSRTFRGSLREAKKARAELIVEVGKGRHSGTRATLDDLFGEWIVELRRKGRSPNTIDGYEKVYRRNIQPTVGRKQVTTVTVKMLTDLYGAHQARGLAPRTVYQIHACLSSMFTQACRWGWRDSNPALWADPPSIPNTEPTVPTPEEVRQLIGEAERGRRPEMARAILVAATTGLRRAELCALRRERDLDLERGLLRVSASVVKLPGATPREIPTKNRRTRVLALDDLTVAILRAQLVEVEARAAIVRVDLVDNPYVFTDSPDGAVPWKPDTVSQYFGRMRKRVNLDHLNFHDLRKFMETYGQEMGYSITQVAMRAGHDPSIAAKHYSGRVSETDRALARAVASLITPPGESS